MDAQTLMRAAIAVARQAIQAGQSPFGCAIAWHDKIVACCHNTVIADKDITAHAEINALRAACRQLGQFLLPEAEVASTCEPCPMCLGALHWARVKRVYFGATIEDAASAGFNELRLPAARLLQLAHSRLELVPDVLSAECRALFDEWACNPNKQVY
jgi:tRNA(Arg) A34 adenosine deaminase TadA